MKDSKVLILVYSQTGNTLKLAQSILRGVEKTEGVKGIIKRIPDTNSVSDKNINNIPIASIEELGGYDGIAFGSPVYFGGIASPMKFFLEQSIPQWTKHEWEGIPATVFMAAGSGAGKELALQSFWSVLATHGMVLVPTGIMGTEGVDKSIPQGNSVLGITSVTGLHSSKQPSADELSIAELQGIALAKQAKAHQYINTLYPKANTTVITENKKTNSSVSVTEENMKKAGIVLPEAPAPVGKYVPFKRAGNLIFINQVSLLNGKIVHSGIIGEQVTEAQAKQETKQAMLNVLAVLKQAVGGDLDRVKQVVQLTGMFYTPKGYTQHAALMNEASNLAVEVFGDRGVHTRATFGASSLPIDSPVEIQAVFEVE